MPDELLTELANTGLPDEVPTTPDSDAQAPGEAVKAGAEATPTTSTEAQAEPTETNPTTKPTVGSNETGEPGQEGYKPKGGFQKRIHTLTREKLEALERVAAVEEENRLLKSGAATAASSDDKEPKPEDYTEKTWDQYYDDRATWRARQVFRTERESAKQAELKTAQGKAAHAAEAEEAAYTAQFQARAAALRKSAPDFDATCFKQPAEGGPVVTTAMRDEIVRQEHGADVLYYLGQHQAEAAQLAQLSGRELQRALWHIEDRLTAPVPPRPTTNAPAPYTPVQGRGGSPQFDADKADYDSYKAWRTKS